MTKAKKQPTKTTAKRAYNKRNAPAPKPSRAEREQAALDEIIARSDIIPGDVGVGVNFARDYAPLQFSLPHQHGYISGRVQQGVDGDELAITTVLQLAGQTQQRTTDHLVIPLDHSREFVARLLKMLDSAKADGLETGLIPLG